MPGAFPPPNPRAPPRTANRTGRPKATEQLLALEVNARVADVLRNGTRVVTESEVSYFRYVFASFHDVPG